MDFPDELIKQVSQKNAVFILGHKLSEWAGMLPYQDIILSLSGRLEGLPPNTSIHNIAQYFQYAFGRDSLLKEILPALDSGNLPPSELHDAILRFPHSEIINIAFDDLLLKGLSNLEIDFTVKYEDSDFRDIPENRVNLIYPFGIVSNPDSLILTTEDDEGNFIRKPKLKEHLQDCLRLRTVLFIGFSVDDYSLKRILSLLPPRNAARLQHYIVQAHIPIWQESEFDRQGLNVINIKSNKPVDLSIANWLHTLLNQTIPNPFRLNNQSIIVNGEVNETIYRDWLKEHTDSIDIRGIGYQNSVHLRRFPLLELFVNLYKEKEKPKKRFSEATENSSKRISLEESINANQAILILGDAGTGKTTFLKYLARSYVDQKEAPLPIFFRITDLVEFLMSRKNASITGKHTSIPDNPECIVDYLDLQSQIHKWTLPKSWLLEKLHHGQIILLIDGLDELSGHDLRVQCVKLFDNAVKKWRKCKWVLTSRPGVLRKQSVPLEFLPVNLDKLEDPEIDAFINTWVRLLFHNRDRQTEPETHENSNQAKQYQQELLYAIHSRVDVNYLARNPMMLTSIVVVHWNEKRLPEGKANLYEAVINWLIKARNELPHRQDAKMTRKIYQHLALAMFEHPTGRRTKVGYRWAAEKIAQFLSKKSQAAEQESMSIQREHRQLLSKLRSALIDKFNNDELRTICFETGVNFEDLPSTSLSGKCRDLVAFLDRRDQIFELVNLVKTIRPKFSWDEMLSTSSTTVKSDEIKGDKNISREQIQEAIRFLEQEEVDTGIIVRRDTGNIAFWHTSFQEYLAACEISSREDSGPSSWWSILKSHIGNPEWEEIFRFVPTILHRLGDERTDLFLKRVINGKKEDTIAEATYLMSFLRPSLQDLFVYNYSANHLVEYIKLREDVMQIFTSAGLEIDLKQRCEAAIAVGQGGDPRFASLEKNWIPIPSGTALIGAQNENPSLPNYDILAEKNEGPVREVTVDAIDFGKFPVTVSEYKEFVQDGGYLKSRFWDSKGWQLRERFSVLSPEYFDLQLTCPNCPIVYISWYEADAYCKWLTYRMSDGFLYRLPTEVEWEYVVRRGQEDYSTYCFSGVTVNSLKAETNWDYVNLKRLAPVGLFPQDKTYDGVVDMNGNIWEWMAESNSVTSSTTPNEMNATSKQPSIYRFLRGGGWHDVARRHRSAYRTEVLANSRYDDTGFRVVKVNK